MIIIYTVIKPGSTMNNKNYNVFQYGHEPPIIDYHHTNGFEGGD
jgi:hypothetical protein